MAYKLTSLVLILLALVLVLLLILNIYMHLKDKLDEDHVGAFIGKIRLRHLFSRSSAKRDRESAV